MAATLEFLSDDDIEQLAWLCDELSSLPSSPSTDEERKDQFKQAIDDHRRYLFACVPSKHPKANEQDLLTYLPFEQLRTNYCNEVEYKKATDSHLIDEFTADQLKKVEHELSLLNKPLAEMLYSVFLSGDYKDGRILIDNVLLNRFGVPDTGLGADDGLLPARIAEIWDRVLLKLHLQGEHNRLNSSPIKRTTAIRSYRFVSKMSAGQPDKLYEELIRAGKFLDSSTDKQAFTSNLTSSNDTPIVWVGGNGQLAYLVEKLITNGLLEAEQESHWAAANHHFIGRDGKRFSNLVRDKKMYEQNRITKNKPKRGNEIDIIIEAVKVIEKINK